MSISNFLLLVTTNQNNMKDKNGWLKQIWGQFSGLRSIKYSFCSLKLTPKEFKENDNNANQEISLYKRMCLFLLFVDKFYFCNFASISKKSTEYY